ncbi:siroheme synthase Met8 [Aspergillus luchuensis]|uniref:Siroheme synthase Met8 n=1 Tax=Aspergillus kawachii TaxID=1069201 RepID=A0A146FCL3_ASPKA|nr:siroheme synthase Met8 [Aspergillus luchuensis]
MEELYGLLGLSTRLMGKLRNILKEHAPNPSFHGLGVGPRQFSRSGECQTPSTRAPAVRAE